MNDKHADIHERLKQYIWDCWEVQTIRGLLDEVERLQKQVEFNRKYGIQSNAMKEIERLRQALEKIAYHGDKDQGYMWHSDIARKVLEEDI